MRARRALLVAAGIVAAVQLTAQSGPTIDLGPARAGATVTRVLQIANNCDSAKVVTISHNMPHLSVAARVTVPPGGSTLELSLAIPAGMSGALRGTMTLTFAGDSGCQPRAATLLLFAEVATGAAAGNAPESESWYDDATGAYDTGRDLADDARNKQNADPGEARKIAQAALDRLKSAEDALDAGVTAGDIGTETASVLRQAIEDAMEIASAVLEDDDPRDEPPPVIYGEELDDAVEAYEGGFEPTQGVWQDDEDFDDFQSKQLTRVSPAHLKAEIKMIVGRPALLIGIRGSRETIYFKGTAKGSIGVPVKARFTLRQGGYETRLHETQTLPDLVPLDGTTGGGKPFHVRIPATNGVPSGAPFRRFKPGPYQIRGELIRADNNAPTGIHVTVEGEAVTTTHPSVLFVPVKLNPWGADAMRDLEQRAAALAEKTRSDVPHLFPMKPHSLETRTGASQDLSEVVRQARIRARENRDRRDPMRIRRDAMAAALSETFGTISVLGGVGRIFVMLSDYDFDQTIGALPGGGRARAYAMSRKVMVGRPNTTTSDVGHELVHTFPFSWAEEEMLGLFQKDWHNKTDPIANGIDVNAGGMRRDKARALMGPSGGAPWITQGTYWHLIDFLQTPVDPALLLVRGFLMREGTGYLADLTPGYQLMGDADLAAGTPSRTQFAIVLRDARGAVLAQYPFDPHWEQPDVPEPRVVVSFLHRVPDLPGVASVHVVDPGGRVLVSRRLSARAPELRIVTPAANQPAALTAGRLNIRWVASDADGDPLLYTVLYSADNGRRWEVVSHEQRTTSFDLALRGRPRQARIKVMATDGMRSVSREAEFSLR